MQEAAFPSAEDRARTWDHEMTDRDAGDDEVRRLQALLPIAEQVAQLGSWDYIPSEGRLVMSDNLLRILGLEPGKLVPTLAYVLAGTHPGDRDRVRAALRELEERGELGPLEFRILRPGGERRHVRVMVAVVDERDGQPYRMVGTLQDFTDSLRAEREIAAHVAVAEALVEWEAFDPGVRRLLARLAGAMDFVAGVFWVPDGDVLAPRVLWHDGLVERPHFEAATRKARMRRGVGLPGRVWAEREPMDWSSNDPTETDPREPAAVSDGLHGALAIPALWGEEVIAVIELKADGDIELSARLMRSLFGISYELGQFLARRRGELDKPLLTPRELEILQLAAEGLSAPESAERLIIAPATVKTHLENIYAKLEVNDKPSAVAAALRLGLIE
jgi:PAS domain S-box-containing protein